jgi:hypothetical protein
MSRAVRHLAAVAALFLAWAPAVLSADDKPKDETPSERIRKALDQPIDLELKEASLAKVIDRFRDKTRLDIAIDRSNPLLGVYGIDPNNDLPQPVQGKFKGTKVRDALRKTFEPYGLAPFIVDDAVLLTTEDVGLQKQLKQRVDVDVEDVPLAAALKQLGRRKAVNLVVDQKLPAKQAEKKVSLQVDDVALETVVRLLAEQAGLKAARVDDVLYVTTPEQAASIAAENRTLMPSYGPYAIYGLGLAGGAGIGAGGVFGAAGIGGALGALGVGGGAFGLGGLPPGGFGGFRVMPAPLGPGGPAAPPPVPDKPNESRPQSRRAAPRATPAVAAQDRPPADGARPEAWALPVLRTTARVRRGRKRPAPADEL